MKKKPQVVGEIDSKDGDRKMKYDLKPTLGGEPISLEEAKKIVVLLHDQLCHADIKYWENAPNVCNLRKSGQACETCEKHQKFHQLLELEENPLSREENSS